MGPVTANTSPPASLKPPSLELHSNVSLPSPYLFTPSLNSLTHECTKVKLACGLASYLFVYLYVNSVLNAFSLPLILGQCHVYQSPPLATSKIALANHRPRRCSDQYFLICCFVTQVCFELPLSTCLWFLPSSEYWMRLQNGVHSTICRLAFPHFSAYWEVHHHQCFAMQINLDICF